MIILSTKNTELLDAWTKAVDAEQKARLDHLQRIHDLNIAAKQLGNALSPHDVLKGEKLTIPIGEKFLQITCRSNWCYMEELPEPYHIEWRNES